MRGTVRRDRHERLWERLHAREQELHSAKADANRFKEERDEVTECYGQALKDLEKVLDQRDEILRWGNAAMVRFEAMLLTTEG
ncbi:hypothetical protein LCGC14_1309940 [marine sediment metagenome]|uniref:Uncharacterized protein n=1 Tax=marine sediment metagenome TaxID=412755 RepID=A0A0F9KN82_9ZZZZ